MDGETTVDGKGAVEISAGVAALLEQVVLEKARGLACAGRYAQAEGTLSALTPHEGKSQPAYFDLLARIRAQQGRLHEAEILWSQAQALDPGNESYQAGLRRIAAIYARPPWLAPLLGLAASLIAVLGIALAGVAIKSYLGRVNAALLAEHQFALRNEMAEILAHQETATARREETALRERTDLRALLTAEIAKAAATGETASPLLQPEPSLKPALPSMKLDIPGVAVKTEGSEFVVIFESGLFSSGAHLKSDAKTLLTAVGRQLEPYVGRIRVRVIGHTDDTPLPEAQEYRDNVALGMARAVAVVEHWRATTELPASLFVIGSMGESLAPYPNDTRENRARNRTVVLRISSDRP